jgi:hypothetical protein
VIFSIRWKRSGPTMGAARGRPVAVACALCFGAGGRRRRLRGLGGPKGQMGQLVAGPIGLKFERKFVSE